MFPRFASRSHQSFTPDDGKPRGHPLALVRTAETAQVIDPTVARIASHQRAELTALQDLIPVKMGPGLLSSPTPTYYWSKKYACD